MKIAMLISGGVDSSLALSLLVEQGHDVTAFYLKIWLEDELSHLGSCPWEQDLRYIEATCNVLNVPLRIIPLQQEYWDIVVRRAIEAIKMGETPNSDVWCNEYIKFGVFWDILASEILPAGIETGSRFDCIATGHYAQIKTRESWGEYSHAMPLLYRSPDPIKDQTYFLCNLSGEQRGRVMFPIGHLIKEQVRAMALERNLPSYMRPDSQGICFLGNFKFRDFVQAHLGTQTGELREFETEQLLGMHEGHWFYTIGQRQGIKLSGGPWFVVAKDAQVNIVYISHKYDALTAERSQFVIRDVRWHDPSYRSLFDFSSSTISKSPHYLLVKVRHRAMPAPATLESIGNGYYAVTLVHKDQGIAPGQFAVLYDGEWCVGAGIIC